MANTGKRGFASMDIEKQRLIASKGGRAAHAKGKAHEWSPEEARAAGRKGGESRGNKGRPSAPIGSSPYSGASYANSNSAGIGEGILIATAAQSGNNPMALSASGLASTFLADAGSSLRNALATPANTPQPNA